MRVLYLLLLSHILTDFLFQNQNMAERKKESLGVTLWHSQIFLISSLILLVPFWSTKLILGLIILATTHFIIDLLKSYLEEGFPKLNFEWLTLDQFTHLGLIFMFWMYFFPMNIKFFIEAAKVLPFFDKGILIFSGYILMLRGGTYFIRRLLEKISITKKDPAEYKVGLIVGNLERILIFTLVLINQYALIGLVLAAKSIARFEDLKKREFAEYYLIGTLSSTIFALAIGIVIKLLIG